MAKDNTAVGAAAPAAGAPASTPASAPAAATPAAAPAAAVVQSAGAAPAAPASASPAQVAAWEYAGRQFAPGYSLTDEDIRELKNGTLRHEDYTRKTQRHSQEVDAFKQNLNRLYRDPTAMMEMFPREYLAQVAAMLGQQDFSDQGEIDPRDLKFKQLEAKISTWEENGKKQRLMGEISSVCSQVGDVEAEEILVEMARGNPGTTQQIAETIKARKETQFGKWLESRKSNVTPPPPNPGQSVTVVGNNPKTMEDAKDKAMRRFGARA